ncbi:MAG: hypothetical protein RMJ98_03895 [Myxococcales bacterium]|nr:hypothetical protein [Polyangiaceae bacterium]MDW8248431.1 hypothetical protein [Myxococcales bacterium]
MQEALVALGISVLMLLASSVAAYRIVCTLPTDCLTHEGPLVSGTNQLWLRPLGLLLFFAGLLMALPGVPGQGVLTACLGLLLLDLPWLRKPLRRLLARRSLFRSINRLRERAGHPPLSPPVGLPSPHGTSPS